MADFRFSGVIILLKMFLTILIRIGAGYEATLPL